MVYMGSKNKYTKYIVPIIQDYINTNNITLFIDCFCGSASLSDKIKCDKIIANDLSPTLIALHKQAQCDFEKIPKEGNKEKWDAAYEQWKIVKTAIDNEESEYTTSMPLYEIGAFEWYSSFSRGGFTRGYARPTEKRDYYKEGYRNHKRQAKSENYKKINFISKDYKKLLDLAYTIKDKYNILFYCDAPYKGTASYGINPNFNFDEYYTWLRKVSQYFPIFISEQIMPDDFPIVWSKNDAIRTNSLTNDFKASERLYLLKNG